MADEGVDISGIDKAALLQALHNATHSMGMGRLQDRGPISHFQAAAVIAARLAGDFSDDLVATGLSSAEAVGMGFVGPKPGVLRFDYLNGRPIKVDIGGDRIDELGVRLYERDCPGGIGTLARLVEEIRARGDGGRRA